MEEYVYPAIFHPNGDGTITVTYPDLPGCITEGKGLGNALFMAQAALTQWIEYLTDKEEPIPPASDLTAIQTDKGEFANLVRTELKDNRAVRRTVSIPKWLDDKVVESGLSPSRVLQDALKEKLHIS